MEHKEAEGEGCSSGSANVSDLREKQKAEIAAARRRLRYQIRSAIDQVESQHAPRKKAEDKVKYGVSTGDTDNDLMLQEGVKDTATAAHIDPKIAADIEKQYERIQERKQKLVQARLRREANAKVKLRRDRVHLEAERQQSLAQDRRSVEATLVTAFKRKLAVPGVRVAKEARLAPCVSFHADLEIVRPLPKLIDVGLGRSCLLVAQVNDATVPVHWLHDGHNPHRTPADADRISILKDNSGKCSVIIKDVQCEDAGVWRLKITERIFTQTELTVGIPQNRRELRRVYEPPKLNVSGLQLEQPVIGPLPDELSLVDIEKDAQGTMLMDAKFTPMLASVIPPRGRGRGRGRGRHK